MGCNCGKSKVRAGARGLTASGARTPRFTVRQPDGRTSRHVTKLEAEAANARAGGKGTVTGPA